MMPQNSIFQAFSHRKEHPTKIKRERKKTKQNQEPKGMKFYYLKTVDLGEVCMPLARTELQRVGEPVIAVSLFPLGDFDMAVKIMGRQSSGRKITSSEDQCQKPVNIASYLHPTPPTLSTRSYLNRERKCSFCY